MRFSQRVERRIVGWDAPPVHDPCTVAWLLAHGEIRRFAPNEVIVRPGDEAEFMMAVLAGGQILLQGNPQDLIQHVNGQIWSKTVSQQEAVELETALPVISKRLFAGRTVLNVLADQAPEGFVATPAGLEDVYFSCLSKHRSAQTAA